jgi:hypothetical protein
VKDKKKTVKNRKEKGESSGVQITLLSRERMLVTESTMSHTSTKSSSWSSTIVQEVNHGDDYDRGRQHG